MSGPQRLFLVILVLVLAGAGASIWWSGDRFDGPDSARPQAPSQTREGLDAAGTSRSPRQGPHANLADLDADSPARFATSVEAPLEIELVQVSKGTYRGSELQAPGSDAKARLTGTIRGSQGVGIPATVAFIAGPNEGRELKTDSKGRFGAVDLYQGLSLVRVTTSGGRTCERELTLRKLSESSLNLDLSTRAGAYVTGTVTDLAGEPIEGAKVRMDGGTCLTNMTGEFEFSRITPGKIPVIVSKHGYASAYQILPVTFGQSIGRDRVTFALHPEASLEVRLEAAVGSPGPVQLFVFPAGGSVVSTGLGPRTFPWHEINPIEVHPGGSVLVEGLQEGHVSLLAFHPGAVASPPIQNMKLFEGRKNQHLIRLRSATEAIRGVVTTPDGRPAKNARVSLEDPSRSFATSKAMQRGMEHQLGMIAPHLPAAVQRTTTDRSGRFVLTAFPKVTPKGYYLFVESQDGSASASRVVKPQSAEINLQLEPIEHHLGALEIRMGGRYQALGVEVTVNGQPREPSVLPADEELVIADLEAGQWRIEAWWNHEHINEGALLTIHSDSTERLPLVLPLGAIEGPAEE